MMSKRTLIMIATTVLLAILLTNSGVGAGPLAGESATIERAATTTALSLLMNYQGRLLDPSTGDPKPDGAYTMSFGIYDVAGGGTALWTETKSVEVTGGLFNTVLGDVQLLALSIFNGQDLWLGVTVGADPETTPRQRILPMPYAIYARKADTVDGLQGADLQRRVSGTCASGNTIRVINADGTVTCEPDQDTTYSAGTGLSLAGTTFSVNFAGSGADTTAAKSDHTHAVTSAMITDGQVSSGDLADGAALAEIADDDGAGSGLDADLLDGQNSTAFAGVGHEHWGANWTGSGTGLTLHGGTVGLSASGAAQGVLGESTDGYGVQGVSKNNDGVFGKSSLEDGVYGETDSGYGAHGYSKDGRGVYGKSQTGYGGWFESDADHFDLVMGGGVGRVNTDPGIADSELILSSNHDVTVRLDNDGGGSATFKVLNSGGSTMMTLDESGNMMVRGELSGGDHGHPELAIAYGFVGADGTLSKGTKSIASTVWDSRYSRYRITISGHSYHFLSYVTVVTLDSGSCAQPCGVETASVSGSLLVYIYDRTGALVQSDFQFVTFKP